MKVVFFGTPDYVLPIVQALHKEFNVRSKERQFIAVVTQPPKPVGRTKMVERTPVDNFAYKHNIDVIFLGEAGWDKSEVPEADLGVVASYGKMIPEDVIRNMKYGIINIHPSLLPTFRGASPIQAQIAEGIDPIGVSFIQMDKQMDHGPIITQFKDHLLPDDTFETVRERLFARAAEVLIEMLPAYLSGKITLKPQDHDKATFTKLITKDDGFVEDLFADPIKTEKLFRAMYPWPGIWSLVTIDNKQLRLKILNLHLEEEKLVLDEVQLEGKNKVTWEQFLEGHKEAKF